MAQFSGFTKDMFSVYAPDKASSNVHNLPRMRNKDTMLALVDASTADLSDALAGLSRAASDEVPNILNQKKVDAQWVYWYRDATARASLASFLEKTPLDQATLFNIAPQDKHVTLAVILRETELWIGLHLATGAVVDRRNLATKLAKSWERERALEIFQALPEGAHVGFEGELHDAHGLTLESLQTLGEQLTTSDKIFHVGHAISTDAAVEKGTELTQHVHGWLAAIAPVYRFSAWTRDNDLIEAAKQIQEEKQQKRRQATAFSPGQRVRFIAGLFTGKLGVVQETDTKAQVKVRVGKMSVVVAGTDLTPAP